MVLEKGGTAYTVATKVDQFRETPDDKGEPTWMGIFFSIICIPVLLAVYFWYIYTTNPTVYNTTIIHASSSSSTGSVLCMAPGGCFFAAYFPATCYPIDDGPIRKVEYLDVFNYDQTPYHFSDSSNANTVPTFLMVASVNLTAVQSLNPPSLASMTLWSLFVNTAKVSQGTSAGANSVTFDATLETGDLDVVNGSYITDITGANQQYAILVTFGMSSLKDSTDSSVQNDNNADGDYSQTLLGTTLTTSSDATFIINADVVGACSNNTLSDYNVSCAAPFVCVTAMVQLDPLVTSTVISKQNTLLALFSQVGGNASNIVVLLGVIVTIYQYICNKLGRSAAVSIVAGSENNTASTEKGAGPTKAWADKGTDKNVIKVQQKSPV